jgi:hypothetical protein
MGVSTDGQLSFGILFEENYVFPWDENEDGQSPSGSGDIEEYWKKLKGFVNPAEDPFDEKGNYKAGFSSDHPGTKEWYSNKRVWLFNNPIPIEIVNYCAGDYPMIILATKHISCGRGYPTVIDPDFLNINIEEEEKKLSDFLSICGIETTEKAKWYLSSYWG